MGFRSIDTPSDGTFADYEVLVQMAENESWLYNNLPILNVKDSNGKIWSSNSDSIGRMRIQSGVVKYSNISARTMFNVKLMHASASSPAVQISLIGPPAAKISCRNITGTGFSIDFAPETKPISGAIGWMAITTDKT